MAPKYPSNTLSRLIELQDIDSQLMDLDELQGNLPGIVEDLTSEVNHLQESINSNKKRLKEIDLETRKFEGLITDRKAKVNKLQDQIYKVKTNREYDALMSEIDHMKTEIDQAEIRELELSEEKDRMEEQLKFSSLKLKEVRGKLATQKEKLEETISSTEKEQKNLLKKREEILVNIDTRYTSMYNRIRRARNGLAVVPISSGACGGCHAKLTSQIISEIRSKSTIHTCPACRRYLYWNQQNGE